MTITNVEVVKRWRRNESGKGLNLRTDGRELWSYNRLIGFTGEDGEKYVYNYTAKSDRDWLGNKVGGYFVSVTTSHHVSLARKVAFAVEPKEVEARRCRLKELDKKLVAYCHKEGCERSESLECPGACCREKLDLDTAIAWHCHTILESGMSRGRKYEAVSVLREVVWLHRGKYSELYEVLTDVAFLLTKE